MRIAFLPLASLAIAAPLLAEKAPAPVVAAPPAAPVSILPPVPNSDVQIVQPVPQLVLPHFTLADANALLAAIGEADSHGLKAIDYQPEALSRAVAAGEGLALDQLATLIFGQLASDLRDGRTPTPARVQWYVRDPDAKLMPTEALLKQALASHDVKAVLKQVEPKHPDYAALRAALAKTGPGDAAKKNQILVNLERWRWLPADLGVRYVMANVPEYMLRVVARGKNVSTYRTVVGKPGATATPQIAEFATGVIVHPTWTVPQSIIRESVGALVRNSPGAAKARGYTWTTSPGGGLTVVQKSGPGNSLGMMKIDMPNAHAIFVHDTNARGLFGRPARALSHGCIRSDRAVELAIVLSMMQAGMAAERAADIFKAGDNARVAFTDRIPVYVNYFTMASTGDGKLASFGDIYGRDAPVVASWNQARVDKSLPQPEKEVKPIEAPGA